jgi:hypothetical protein
MSELEIIGYEDITIGNSVVQQPIYNQEIVVIGSGEDSLVIALSEHKAQALANASTPIEPIDDPVI